MSATEPIKLAEFMEMSLERLKSVGPGRARAFAEAGINNIAELLRTYPRRYLDRTQKMSILEMGADKEASVVCKVVSVSDVIRVRNRNLKIVNVDFVDEDATPFSATFFNQPWRARQLEEGMSLALYGKLKANRGKLEMSHPAVDLVGDQTGGLIPVYPSPQSEKLYPVSLSRGIHEALRRSVMLRGIYDPLRSETRDRLNLISREEALQGIHKPQSFADVGMARKRLAFDELLYMQLFLVGRRNEMAKQRGVSHSLNAEFNPLKELFFKRLNYELTGSQKRAIAEIEADLASDSPMNRLLQGDVGAGKTIVALAAIMDVIQSGHQTAFLVPTEVLAEQHFEVILDLVEGLEVGDADVLGGARNINIQLLTNRILGNERKQILQDLRNGKVDLLVGTSALIYEGVNFLSLGLVVVDEQHRFGVDQRALLLEKSGTQAMPDSLAMTATPIPRTVAMSIYGDLDVSNLTELPPGRIPIITELVTNNEAVQKMWEEVKNQLTQGRRAFIVCPLIGSDEQDQPSETLNLESEDSVLATFQELSQNQLKGFSLGLLHGRMSFQEKNQIMNDFRAGVIQALVATTVVEVGVDVSEATVMVILGAHRFGIAQLHQLRGRVGRKDLQSYCFLVSDSETERLKAVTNTSDGFKLADIDLDLRGEGTILGSRQSGKRDLRVASLLKHRNLVPESRREAEELLADGQLKDLYPDLEIEVLFHLGEEDRAEYLLRS